MKRLFGINVTRSSMVNALIACGVCIAVIVAGYMLLQARAGGYVSAVEAEHGTLVGTAQKIHDPAAVGGQAVVFSAPVPPPSPMPSPIPSPPVSAIKPLTPGTTWQWQLSGALNETVLDSSTNSKKMYDIDVFDVSAAAITRLKAKGITVVCYFSAGSAEDWRPDYTKFTASLKGQPLDGWAGETWLDIRQLSALAPIMGARMDLAVQKGCDGVEPDNVDAYTHATGFVLTSSDQLAYNRMLAAEAHKRKLSIGLKNNVEQIAQLVNDFDWALNEQCYHFNECAGYSAFIAQNKAVFGVEYHGDPAVFCSKANSANYDWLKKDVMLGALPRQACRNG